VAYAHATLDRAEDFAVALTRDLARWAALERESMAILAELAALTVCPLAPDSFLTGPLHARNLVNGRTNARRDREQ
jgi:hypothetical protein